ncbi:MAG: FAD-dependent 5-carboxymethylaminomethyl-2-thiouridine(34) oxidoreductase MnmC [Gammaproteobacteria bacterium]
MPGPLRPLPPFPERLENAELDWRDGTPVSRPFGDVYFSRDGAIAETGHVFIDGNRLRLRLALGDFRAFTIGETGFGTGLNFLVAAQAFLALAPDDATLHFVTTEKFPLASNDLERAHACWPELATLAAELRAALPPSVTGFHHRLLYGGRVRLTLLLGDATALLPRLQAHVDAWFLDGFAPAKNGDLWQDGLFAEIARLSAPDATFATFTAAGDVRRGLAAVGFEVEKTAGFGSKRDMLRGRYVPGERPRGMPGGVPHPAPRSGSLGQALATVVPTETALAPAARSSRAPQDAAPRPARRAAVIGGGLAGCAAARALAERGWQVTLIEQRDALAAETSGNLAGAVYPKFSLHETAQNRWYRDSYLYALARLPQVLGVPDGVHWARCGLLQLPGGEEDDDHGKFAAIAACSRWPAAVLRAVDATEAGTLAGIEMESGGLWFAGAGWVHPPALCRALATHDGIALKAGTCVTALSSGEAGWSLRQQDVNGEDSLAGRGDGDADAHEEVFDVVVVANALAAGAFAQTSWLPLRRVRGQVTHVAATGESVALRAVVCHAGYVTPARDGVHCVGATFGPRDDDPAVRSTDHAENLADLASACPSLYVALGDTGCDVVGGRTGFRAQTPDYLPVIGPIADAEAFAAQPDGKAPPALPGLYVLGALGAKGISFSLLGAEIIAAQVEGEPLPVDSEVAAALAPGRFLQRARRRGKR